MTVHEFAKGMAEGVGIGKHKILIVHNGKDVFKGTFNDIIASRCTVSIAESMVLGVSMLHFSSDHEYSTMISI